MLPLLRTERLILRALHEEDAADLHPAFADAEVMRWWSSGPHRSVSETIDYVVGNAASEDWPTWAVTLDGGKAVGWVVLSPRRPGVAEIGYILRRDYWRQGFAREAVSAVIDHGFATLELRRIYADTDPENEGSAGLLRSMGFTLEGRLRGEWETHIGIRDSLIWGLLAAEWGSAGR